VIPLASRLVSMLMLLFVKSLFLLLVLRRHLPVDR
jgi:hypothetical protein